MKETTLLWNNGGEETQEDNPTPAVYAADVGLSSCISFPLLFHSRLIFLRVFILMPCLCTFHRSIPA